MTLVNGTTDDGGAGTGPDGHRCVVDYSISQDIANNRSTLTYAYGVNYGDPNYWNNINHRSFSWAALQGNIVGSSGGGTAQSTNAFINTSDPGYGGQTHFFGGVWSGSITVQHDSNGEAVVRLNAAMQFNSGANDSHITNHDIVLPDIVQDPVAPGTPTGTRVNDGQINLSWTNNSSSHHEYASQSVQRSVDGGAFATIASGLSAGATSYSDTTTSANHRYRYRIRATNAAGSATSGTSASVYTTPGTPTIGTATKLTNNNINLSWTNNVGYGDTAYTTRIEESQNGGAFTEIDSVAGGVTSYEHVSPSTLVTHRYRVRHRSTTGSLNGSYSGNSNTVTLLSTANAPTGLSPSGAARDAADDIELSWTHNPTDGTPQSERRVQAKVNAGSYADLINDASSTESYTVAGGTWTNGDTITWKVATAGENGTHSADSAEASFTLSAKPTVTINQPESTYDTSTLTVTWGYFQAQASAQASWEARLYDDADVLLESITGTTETEGTFTHTVADGETYTVAVTVTSAAGLTSTEASQAFTVAYLLPAAVTVAGEFDNAAGFVVLTLTGEAASSDVIGLVLDGTGDYASTPDDVSLRLSTDFDIRMAFDADDWTPASDTVLVSKWADTGDQRAYALQLKTDGTLEILVSEDGTAPTIHAWGSSVAVTPPTGPGLCVRAQRVGTTLTFYTSSGIDLTAAVWVQLGTTVTAIEAAFAGTAPLIVGAGEVGVSAALAGTVYAVEVLNESAATVANPNFAAEDEETTSFDDGAGRTWTLAGDASIVLLAPGTETIATVDVQRQINGGEWVTVLTGVVLDVVTLTAVVQDTTPITVGTNTYRAVAYSALPSSSTSAEAEVTTSETTWGYLSGGTGFGTVARFRAMPTYAASASRAKALYHFAGRPKPVQLAGEALTATLAVSGRLSDGAGTAADFEALGQAEGVVCWRGPDGRRLFGSVDKVTTSTTRLKGQTAVSFTVTELDFTEGDQ